MEWVEVSILVNRSGFRSAPNQRDLTQQALLHRLGVFQDEDTMTPSDFKTRLGIFRHPVPSAGPAMTPKYLRAHSREINEVSHLNLNAGELGPET